VLKPDLETFSKNSLIVTGDIKWHDWNLVNDLKINTLDIGHDVEKYFNDLICDYLEDTLDELSVKKIYPKIKILTLNYDSNL
jgi:putative NIF3 family GTP cyclohydrolase 1 type 2